MTLFSVYWVSAISLAEVVNLSGQPVMNWDVEKETTGGVVLSDPKVAKVETGVNHLITRFISEFIS